MERLALALAVALIPFAGLFAAENQLLGPNVHIYGPGDDPSAISAELDSIHSALQYSQFSAERHAVFFLPGDYTKVGTIKVPYYMAIAGLGRTPYYVKLSNIETTNPIRGSKNATLTFWRSVENVYVVKNDSAMMYWGVSQAAPMRRVVSERPVSLDIGGYASGGFSADCLFLDSVCTRHQQQWYMRNSFMAKSANSMSRCGWNYAFQGVELADTTGYARLETSWVNDSMPCNITFAGSTPIIREKPFLFVDEEGRYKVFVPSIRRNATGVSYSKECMGAGKEMDLERDFFVARPGVAAKELNKQLESGKSLFFTPGVYELEQPLVVKRNGTVVMGIGMATLVPGESNTESAIVVSDNVKDVVICSLMFDALYSSRTLLKVGETINKKRSSDASVVLSDIFCRVGGMVDRDVNADIMIEINSNNVVGDHFWLWRADHGAGVGWFKNTCKNGFVVNGDNVTIYGLFNEHAQQYQTVWNGEYGRCYFYQSETPYDMPSQDVYMSHDGTMKGYASYKVNDNVKHHFATMMGVYDVFIKTGDSTIEGFHSIEVPENNDVNLYHVCNFGLSNNGSGFRYVINNTQSSTLGRRITRWYVDRYPCNQK